jgi:hypothetical protein
MIDVKNETYLLREELKNLRIELQTTTDALKQV